MKNSMLWNIAERLMMDGYYFYGIFFITGMEKKLNRY